MILSSEQPRPTIRLLWIVAGLASIVAAVVLFAYNPAESRFFPRCMFHELTGLNCPGCGGQRALHHLLHGEFVQAFHCNPLLIALLPPGLWGFARLASRSLLKRNQPALFKHHLWAWVLLVTVIAFGIARNLPYPVFAWMNP